MNPSKTRYRRTRSNTSFYGALAACALIVYTGVSCQPRELPVFPALRARPAATTIPAIVREAVRDAHNPRITVPLVNALIHVESSGRVDAEREEAHLIPRVVIYAESFEHGKCLASSHGLTQILGLTARGYGVKCDELKDPDTNVRLATMVLGSCLQHERNQIKRALACYNAGPRRGKYPAQSVKYADKILARL